MTHLPLFLPIFRNVHSIRIGADLHKVFRSVRNPPFPALKHLILDRSATPDLSDAELLPKLLSSTTVTLRLTITAKDSLYWSLAMAKLWQRAPNLRSMHIQHYDFFAFTMVDRLSKVRKQLPLLEISVERMAAPSSMEEISMLAGLGITVITGIRY